MQFGKASLSYRQAGQVKTLAFTDLNLMAPGLRVDSRRRPLAYGEVISITLTSAVPLELGAFSLQAELGSPSRMLSNGFQTWSQTRVYSPEQYMAPLFAPARPLLAPYGDYRLLTSTGKKGQFHSWSWTGFEENGRWLLLASISEDWGYTLFAADLIQGSLSIRRDCLGEATSEYPLLEIYIGQGSEQQVWEEFASLLPRHWRPPGRCTGWTSWYNYYTKINEEIICSNLRALSASGHPFDIFQIDDGWQGGIGDWLDVNAKFPSGLDTLARAARDKGFRPGLWLAPFICDAKSRLWREHYDWVLKDEKGRPVKAGINPGWNGWFYALDFYAPGFQTWLRQVFSTVFNQWGFQMVKLDFLYAVALIPRQGRCRGRIMAEAMEFLCQTCGDNFILGCGVPLAQAAGRADYCRIGADVAPFWEDSFLAAIKYRERVSTINSLYSTLHRHMLDRRLFRNDPDVFILRDGKPGVNANKLTRRQRHTLFFLNNLLGGLVFLSDHIGEYTPEQKELLAEMFPNQETEIINLAARNDVYTIEFKASDQEYIALANLSRRPARQQLPPGQWFHPELIVTAGVVDLEPYQTICLVKVQAKPGPHILGSSGHIYPGGQIESFIWSKPGWTLTLKAHAAPHTRVWIAVPDGSEELQVNGQIFPVRKEAAIPWVVI